ncbi:MAG: molybdopterin-guanine dinucleotide biosynthesis protein B [Spirochaetes bacterium]|nr:molybdopterin-guanine dinucleotide biosynthesis protein B [Spirochaetota bacterium]
MKLSAAILTGGKSRRMGRDKSFLTYRGDSFIGRIREELSGFDEVLISVSDEGQKKEHLHFFGRLPDKTAIVEDRVKDIGPLGGIYSSLAQCKGDYLFVCATDMPLLKKELVDFMTLFISGDYDCFVLKSGTKIHPLCAIYSKAALPAIEEMIRQKDRKMLILFDKCRTKYIPLEYSRFGEDAVTNINTYADFSRLEKPGVKTRIFCVSGVKNSGKTTLICKLICAMKKKGWRLAVIKHDGHDFEIDAESKDTHKYMKAGSDASLIYSQKKYALIKRWETVRSEAPALATVSAESRLGLLLEHFADMDLVIIEGLKHSAFPKIETVLEKPVCSDASLLAIATDGGFRHERVKTLGRDDIETMVSIIESEVMGL